MAMAGLTGAVRTFLRKSCRRGACLAAGVLALALAVAAAPGSALADDIFHDGRNFLSGLYEITELRTAGVYSGEDEAFAGALVGRNLTVHGDHVALPTGGLCHIAATNPTELRDGRESFGSAGGSWSELGLAQLAGDVYEVASITLECLDEAWEMIVQPETETYLLRYYSVYLALQRV